MSNARGIPLLSGPPTIPAGDANDSSCRKCAKDLRGLFTRERRCNHCGYMYCSSHANLTALMPRPGPSNGFDPAEVCSWCIEYLMITAAGRAQLKAMPLAKLRKYIDAYNLKSGPVIEKGELVDIILAARGPNGCLPPQNEEYYRRNSVPSAQGSAPRGFFARTFGDAPPPQPRMPRQPLNTRRSVPNFARPDLDRSDDPPLAPPRPAPSQPAPRSPAPPHAHARPQAPPPPRPATASPLQRPRATSVHATPPAPPPQPPSLDELLDMTPAAVGVLPVGIIKAILFQNHVRLGAGVLEKAELVDRVLAMVDDERQERAQNEARRAAEEEEERLLREERERARAPQPEPTAEAISRSSVHDTDIDDARPDLLSGGAGNSSPPPAEGGTKVEVKPLLPKAQAMAAHLERTGLCVICQDAEANMAIIDCGHLAMCRACSDLIMGSTRECPLCRTRIVTEQRLLRIFKA